MTHFTGLVLVDPKKLERSIDVGEGKPFSAVAHLVSQYCEGDEWGADGTRYDWFAIGGRSTGLLDSYEPWEDERNYSPCKFCEGTGITTQAVADHYPAYQDKVGKPCVQCNIGYGGEQKPFPGRSLNFSFAPHSADVMPARNIDIERMRYIPNVLVTPDGEWHERHRMGLFVSHLPKEDGSEDPDEQEWNKEFCRLLDDNRDAVAVVVDFHV